ncbi:MAG: hypothetical protein QXU71_03060 [Candidatus Aenigmatarchaeota archaeon]
MKKFELKIFVLFCILLNLTIGSTFTNKDWIGDSFPYKGALFLHDGDYVEFYCDSSHSKFYYWTLKSGNCPIEVMERKSDGSWKQLKVIILSPTNIIFNGSFKNLNGWGVYDLSSLSGCLNKQIGLHLRENRVIDGKSYGDKDIVIRLVEGTSVVRWKGVDSNEYFDLDSKALKDDKWKDYANNLADKRIATVDKIINTFYEISAISETEQAYKQGLNSILGGIASSYFPPDHLSLTSDYLRNLALEYSSVYAQYSIKITRSLNYVVMGALADVYSGAFDGLQYLVWMQNILNKALPQAVLTVQETYNYIRSFKSLVASLKTASWSNLESLKNLISNEKSARNSVNKDLLRNFLNSQLELLHSSSSDSNPLFTNDQDISKGSGLSLWHIFAKACSIAKSRENNQSYPKVEREAYRSFRILTEKLMVSIVNLLMETAWVKNAEERSYLLSQ